MNASARALHGCIVIALAGLCATGCSLLGGDADSDRAGLGGGEGTDADAARIEAPADDGAARLEAGSVNPDAGASNPPSDGGAAATEATDADNSEVASPEDGAVDASDSAVSTDGAAVDGPLSTGFWRAVSAGTDHACGITADGSTRCWGDDSYGQLGDGQSIHCPSLDAWSVLPVAVPGLQSNTRLIAAGGNFSCAITDTGAAKCWGAIPQSGDGNCSPFVGGAFDIPGDYSDAAQLVAGRASACVRRTSGEVLCWGVNQEGVIGDGTMAPTRPPTLVSNLGAASDLSLAGDRACAIVGGGVKCWGAVSGVRMGDGTVESTSTPTAVSGITDAITVRTASDHTCALVSSGGVRCWGNDYDGELGDGRSGLDPYNMTVWSTSPVATGPTPSPLDRLAVPEGQACVLSAGTLWCWGKLFGTPNDPITTPTALTTAPDAFSELSGRGVVCGLTTSGEIECWGRNNRGQIGDGSLMDRTAPTVVSHALGTTHVNPAVIPPSDQCSGDAGADAAVPLPSCFAETATTPSPVSVETLDIATPSQLTMVGYPSSMGGVVGATAIRGCATDANDLVCEQDYGVMQTTAIAQGRYYAVNGGLTNVVYYVDPTPPIPPNTGCAEPVDLSNGSTYFEPRIVDSSPRTYTVTLTQRTGVQLTVQPIDSYGDSVVTMRSACLSGVALDSAHFVDSRRLWPGTVGGVYDPGTYYFDVTAPRGMKYWARISLY